VGACTCEHITLARCGLLASAGCANTSSKRSRSCSEAGVTSWLASSKRWISSRGDAKSTSSLSSVASAQRQSRRSCGRPSRSMPTILPDKECNPRCTLALSLSTHVHAPTLYRFAWKSHTKRVVKQSRSRQTTRVAPANLPCSLRSCSSTRFDA